MQAPRHCLSRPPSGQRCRIESGDVPTRMTRAPTESVWTRVGEVGGRAGMARSAVACARHAASRATESACWARTMASDPITTPPCAGILSRAQTMTPDAPPFCVVVAESAELSLGRTRSRWRCSPTSPELRSSNGRATDRAGSSTERRVGGTMTDGVRCERTNGRSALAMSAARSAVAGPAAPSPSAPSATPSTCVRRAVPRACCRAGNRAP